MKFDDLDAKMRVYETAHDHCALPGLYLVARLDGRSFTRLTKDLQAFEAPFDPRFRDLMTQTTAHLMECGFRVIYGYTQSDEISLLLHRDESAYSRKLRKLISILAGEASAKFSLLLGALGCFDGRISQLPRRELVLDYFQWRQEDAHRNALNSHCYWLLRRQGQSVAQATTALEHVSVSAKNELLFEHGINFNELPLWQRRGIGVYWQSYQKEGLNPKTGQTVLATRRRLYPDMALPMKDEYSLLLEQFIQHSEID
jgi:tRNA(His) 5'-end guanylyltransferase